MSVMLTLRISISDLDFFLIFICLSQMSSYLACLIFYIETLMAFSANSSSTTKDITSEYAFML